MHTGTISQAPNGPSSKARGLMGLGLGIFAFWLLTYVVLPTGQKLPVVKPVMDVLIAEDVDAGSYWYTQSEETAVGAMYIKNTLVALEQRK